MTPREFLKRYAYESRLVTGEYFSSEPLTIEEGDRVGVVLLNLGGPFNTDDVGPFLYNLFMDPAIIDIPLSGIWRHWLSQLIAKTRSRKVAKDYESIGGGSPINRLTQEQCERLEKHLNENYSRQFGASFRTYVAMRYWHPKSEEAARRMEQDGINKVVLLPLYPHYSKTTTGSSLIYWWSLQEAGEIPRWPTTFVFEYAANPKYILALNERIDEGLQRFAKNIRNDVHLVFSAHGTPVREMKERRDPYCCLVHSTIEQVMEARKDNRSFDVSFQSKVGPAEWLTPSTPDKLKELAEKGRKAVLMVPIAFVSDHVETAFELDIEVREEAESFGIHHYEVMSGLNSHPLFIEALSEATIAQLLSPGQTSIELSGDGAPAASKEYEIRPLNQLPRYKMELRKTRCHQCEKITEARCWTQPSSNNGVPEKLKPNPAVSPPGDE